MQKNQNLSTRQTQKIISILEIEIVELGKELTTRMPILRELQKDYEAQKATVDTLQRQLDENKATIAALIGVNKVSITASPQKKKYRQPFYWMRSTCEILKTEKRFMTLDEVIKKILERHPEQKKGAYSFKNYFPTSYKANNPKILEYKGKIGLEEWFLNSQPLPQFMKEFMYSTSKSA